MGILEQEELVMGGGGGVWRECEGDNSHYSLEIVMWKPTLTFPNMYPCTYVESVDGEGTVLLPRHCRLK